MICGPLAYLSVPPTGAMKMSPLRLSALGVTTVIGGGGNAAAVAGASDAARRTAAVRATVLPMRSTVRERSSIPAITIRSIEIHHIAGSPGCSDLLGADGAVDAFPDEVGVAVVPGVLVDHVQHHQAQRHVLVPGPLMGDHVERLGLALDAARVFDLGLPGREGLRPGGSARVVGDLEIAGV